MARNIYKGGVLTKDGSNRWVVVMTPSCTIDDQKWAYITQTWLVGLARLRRVHQLAANTLGGGALTTSGNVVMGSNGKCEFLYVLSIL